MKITILAGKLVNNEVTAEEDVSTITSRIQSGEIVVIRDVFDKNELLALRDRIHEFGTSTPEFNPDRTANTVNFHRIDNNHPKMMVRRIAHFYRFSYHNSDEAGVFKFMHPINILRNQVAGLPRDYTFYNDDDGFLSQPAMLHYPAGGGYMMTHVDPLHPQQVELVLLLSERGTDFQTGGLKAKSISDEDFVDIEGQLKIGDICMFRPDIPHGVEAIDKEMPLDWKQSRGRWIMFSPIAHIRDQSKNESEVKRY